MKKGPILTGAIVAIATLAMVFAFMNNASPFVTIKQAKKTSGDQLHLAGDIVPDSVNKDPSGKDLRFDLRDENGDVVTVDHTGEMPNNLPEVKKVVAIGSMKNGEFHSTKLLVKCPSKYEAERKVASNN